MIGIDIVKIDRISRLKSKFGEKFLDRFLSPQEIQIANSIETIAGFYAAKEALAKALGCGIGSEFGFFDVQITKTNLNAPKLNINPNIINKFQIKQAELSISHDAGIAVACVFLIRN